MATGNPPMSDLNPATPAARSPWNPFEAVYRSSLSLERLRRYRKPRDKMAWAPAIGRYAYDVELASALCPLLNWSEVVLRNRLHSAIAAAYPPDGIRVYRRVASWLDAHPGILQASERARVEQAILDFDRRNAGHRQPKLLTEGRLVAELRFGFWTRLLDGAYENWRITDGQRLWPALLDRTFPDCPPRERTRKALHARFSEIREIRNRVFHHERISPLADLALYDRFIEAVGWIQPTIADDLRTRERPRFATLLSAGPQPFIEWAATRAADMNDHPEHANA